MLVFKKKGQNTVLTRQNLSAHWASGHHSFPPLLWETSVQHCTETWFPLLTFLQKWKPCLTLNKLLNFHFWLCYGKAIWPWASYFPIFGTQFGICLRRAGSASLEGPESKNLWLWHCWYIITLFISLCPSLLYPFGQWAKACFGSNSFLERGFYKVA